MTTKLSHLLVLAAVSLAVLTPRALAETQLGNKKGPTSKIFLAETKGETQIENHGKIFPARQASAFDAPGTVIETKADAHDAFVYSNGSGLFVDQNSRVEISLFNQEPFPPPSPSQQDETPVEPSVSESQVRVVRGAVGICTGQLLSGSTMTYSTSQALVNIRQGRVAIQTAGDTTIIDLLEGDITVRTGKEDAGGQILRPGDRATIRAGAAGQSATIALSQTPADARKTLDDRVTIACNARRTVVFRSVGKNAGLTATTTTTAAEAAAGAQQEIVASPAVPQNLPNNITISADRLPGG